MKRLLHDAEPKERPFYLTCVVFVYLAACNPLSLEHVAMLRRAKEAIEAFHRVVVAGCLVIPYSTKALEMHYKGEKRAAPGHGPRGRL